MSICCEILCSKSAFPALLFVSWRKPAYPRDMFLYFRCFVLKTPTFQVRLDRIRVNNKNWVPSHDSGGPCPLFSVQSRQPFNFRDCNNKERRRGGLPSDKTTALPAAFVKCIDWRSRNQKCSYYPTLSVVISTHYMFSLRYRTVWQTPILVPLRSHFTPTGRGYKFWRYARIFMANPDKSDN